MEDYQITDDAGEGFDIAVSVSLKQYRHYGTKTVTITQNQAVTPTSSRETSGKQETLTHTVAAGDCLWNIAQKYMGDGNRYPELYKANQAVIDKGNQGTGNPRYTIYPGQVFVIPK